MDNQKWDWREPPPASRAEWFIYAICVIAIIVVIAA